jgi:hypothetical protein
MDLESRVKPREVIERIEGTLRHAPLEDFYMSENQGWKTYCLQRLGFKGNKGSIETEQDLKNNVRRIELFNGILNQELKQRFHNAEQIELNMAHEKALFDEKTGTIYISQPTSRSRQIRYEDMIYLCMKKMPEWDFQFDSKLIEFKGKPSLQSTERIYEKHAYDFVKQISLENNLFKDIDYITLGRIEWLNQNKEVIDTDYAKYSIHEIKGRKILSIDYPFADQAGHIVKELLTNYRTETPIDIERQIHIIVYGKVGSLDGEKNNINDIVIPNGIIAFNNLNQRSLYPLPIINAINHIADENNYIFNTQSIPLQRLSFLKKAKESGCTIVEMEAYPTTAAINTARASYSNNLHINQSFVGFVSDIPPKITLTANIDYTEGKEGIERTIVDYVSR